MQYSIITFKRLLLCFQRLKLHRFIVWQMIFARNLYCNRGKYMIEDKKFKYCNKSNRMNDAEFMVILILFHSGGFGCFKH
mgnify:CR=1 FL=1|jgi:hypothetical protein